MIPAFKSAAKELLDNSDLSIVELLAKALAKAVVSQCSSTFGPFVFSLKLFFFYKKNVHKLHLQFFPELENFGFLCNVQGYTEIKKRSLLTSMENYVTLLLESGRPIFTPS